MPVTYTSSLCIPCTGNLLWVLDRTPYSFSTCSILISSLRYNHSLSIRIFSLIIKLQCRKKVVPNGDSKILLWEIIFNILTIQENAKWVRCERNIPIKSNNRTSVINWIIYWLKKFLFVPSPPAVITYKEHYVRSRRSPKIQEIQIPCRGQGSQSKDRKHIS